MDPRRNESSAGINIPCCMSDIRGNLRRNPPRPAASVEQEEGCYGKKENRDELARRQNIRNHKAADKISAKNLDDTSDQRISGEIRQPDLPIESPSSEQEKQSSEEQE